MALSRYNRQHDFSDFFASGEEEEEEAEGMNLFAGLKLTPHIEQVVKTDNIEEFRKPILKRATVRDQAEYIQRLCGTQSQKAMNISMELISDLEKGTQYPPEVKPLMNVVELANNTNKMIAAITLKKKEKK